LECRDIAKVFGALRALDGVTLEVRRGGIAGLIGPNGSGKSTLVNVLSGVVAPTHGEVLVGDRALTGKAANVYLHAGVARTFQTIRLFSGLTVLENVEVGVTGGRTRGRRRIRQAAMPFLDMLDLGPMAERQAGTLPYAAQRRLEIARALATSPSFLLLDEPAAGMNHAETRDLAERLTEIAATQDLGILLVEHDVQFTMTLCSHLTVLSNGTVLSQGPPAVVRQDRAVIDTYLGTSAVGAA
jgi:branched-chain amino acid transport system permease protein